MLNEDKTQLKPFNGDKLHWVNTDVTKLEVGDKILYANTSGYMYSGTIARVLRTMVELEDGTKVTKHIRRIVVLK